MKYWCIKVTEENRSILEYWAACNENGDRCVQDGRPYLHDDARYYQCPQRGCDEIDFATWRFLPEVSITLEWNYEG